MCSAPYLRDAVRGSTVTRPGARRQRSCAALTPREREILDLVAEGKTNGQIAEQLWISGGDRRARHLENTFAKLGGTRDTVARGGAAARDDSCRRAAALLTRRRRRAVGGAPVIC